jgi:hypothetical protein
MTKKPASFPRNRMSEGNNKIRGKNVLIFNLPAVITCLNNSDCATKCYAKKAEKMFEVVRRFRALNFYLAVNEPDLLKELIGAQIKRKLKHTDSLVVRIHESGDFFCQDYINMWTDIVNSFPQVRFWCYTKTKDLLDFSLMESLPNINVINSYINGKLNFGSKDYVNNFIKDDPECFLCPAVRNHSIACSVDCQYCLSGKKPVFYKH